MIRRLLILFLILNITINAGFADSSCLLTDPCNCSCSSDDPDCMCPPYNRKGDKVGCLNKNSPETFTPYYLYNCIETANSSDYYDPKVLVRYQSCNGVGCWANSKALSWDGECVVWPSPYGFPPVRYCARLAINGDDGYTKDKHIDMYGNEQNDPDYPQIDGTSLKLELPKVCVYLDPSALETIYDIVDLIPNKSPFHVSNGTISPIADLIFTAFENKIPFSDISSSYILLAGLTLVGGPVVGSLMLSLILLEKLAPDYYARLKQEFQMNKLVTAHLGCVNIPLAPGPDRYCPFLSAPTAKAVVQKICPVLNDGTTSISTTNDLCYVSNKVNNLIRNSIRVGYNNLIPICDSSKDPYATDLCVNISFNAGNINTPSTLHSLTSSLDIIPKCNAIPPASGEQPCVETILTNASYRVVYGIKSGASYLTSIDGYASDLKDCSDASLTANQTCQQVWGVNTGDFNDLEIIFPNIETSYNITEQSSIGSVVDMSNNPQSFQASIVRVPTDIPSVDITQTPNQICVFEGVAKSKLVGCIDRLQQLPNPIVYSCDSPQSQMSCISSYFNPKIVVEIKSGNDATQGVVEVNSVYSATAPIIINLAGNSYNSFVTDDNYQKMPFSIPPAVSQSTLFGNYSPAGQPLDSSGNRITSLKFMNGLEYLGGQYSLGGKKVCLNGINIPHCSQDNPTNCVLTQLTNSNIVSCSTLFDYSTTKYPGLKLCNASESTSCNIMDGIPKNGGGTLNIRECNVSGAIYHCYESNTNLCNLSFQPSERSLPPYNGPGTEVLDDTEYFVLNTVYDSNITAIRDKTEIEHGFCIEVPPAQCNSIDATSGNSDVNGYASWVLADVGTTVTGSCIAGYSQVNGQPVTRNCVIDFSSGGPQVKFGDLINGYKCELTLAQVLDIQGSDAISIASLTKVPPVIGTYGGQSSVTQEFVVQYQEPWATITEKNLSVIVKVDDLSKIISFNLNQLSTSGQGDVYVNGTPVATATILGGVTSADIQPYLFVGDNEIIVRFRTVNPELGFYGLIYTKFTYQKY